MDELLELYETMGISPAVYAYGERTLEKLKDRFAAIDQVAEHNQAKVLWAMQQLRLIVRHQNGQHLMLFHAQPSIRIVDLIIKDFPEKHKPGMLHFHIPGLPLDLVFGYFTKVYTANSCH